MAPRRACAAARLLLPGVLDIATALTPVAATGIAVIMLLAMGFHACRKEPSAIAFNALLLILAAIVMWGRFMPPRLLTGPSPPTAALRTATCAGPPTGRGRHVFRPGFDAVSNPYGALVADSLQEIADEILTERELFGLGRSTGPTAA
ncbi:DoxX family protein [Streptomyces mirabilis]|uniref:DoxX family protein n=1 Tax=Streptomyces mirabilis TaxID=68239 RepID=UPI0037101B3E